MNGLKKKNQRHPIANGKQTHAVPQGPSLSLGLSLGTAHLSRLCGGLGERKGGLLLTALSRNSWCFSSHQLSQSAMDRKNDLKKAISHLVGQFSRSVLSDSLQPHGLQHARPPCPSPTPGVYPNSRPSSQGCHPTVFILSSPSPALTLFQHQGLSQWVSSSHEVATVLEFQLQHQSFQWIFRDDLLQDGLVGSPCSPRDSQGSSPHHSSEASVLWRSAFFKRSKVL